MSLIRSTRNREYAAKSHLCVHNIYMSGSTNHDEGGVAYITLTIYSYDSRPMTNVDVAKWLIKHGYCSGLVTRHYPAAGIISWDNEEEPTSMVAGIELGEYIESLNYTEFILLGKNPSVGNGCFEYFMNNSEDYLVITVVDEVTAI